MQTRRRRLVGSPLTTAKTRQRDGLLRLIVASRQRDRPSDALNAALNVLGSRRFGGVVRLSAVDVRLCARGPCGAVVGRSPRWNGDRIGTARKRSMSLSINKVCVLGIDRKSTRLNYSH